MGQCGCETTPVGMLLGPNGHWYVLEVFPGCPDCGTDWGLGVTGVQEGSDEWEWGAKEVPEITVDHLGQWGTMLLSTDVLRRLYVGDGDEYDDANLALEDFIRRGGLRDVFYESREGAHDGKK